MIDDRSNELPGWNEIDRGAQQDLSEDGAPWCPSDYALYWVDILSLAFNHLTLRSSTIERRGILEPLGWAVTRAHGELVGGLHSSPAMIRLDSLVIGPLRAIEPWLPGNRMNDGKTDLGGAI